MSTIFCTKQVDSALRALVQQYNALHDSVAVADGYGSNHFHNDISGVPSGDFSNPSSSDLQVSAADASEIVTLCALINNIKGVLEVHFADTSAHLLADTVSLAALQSQSLATDLTSAKLTLNNMRTFYEWHRTASGVHLSSDTVSEWTGADCTNEATAETLANFGKSIVNDHIKSGPTVGKIKLL